jgi:hypothetical protein
MSELGGGLRRPVSPLSILGPHPEVRYTEIGGVGILCRADRKTVSALSPAAVAAWARFDGRTPLETMDGGGDLVELARRLRAIGMLIDAPAGSAGPRAIGDPGAAAPAQQRSDVTVRGSWRPSDDGAGAIVVLAGAEEGDAEAATVTLVVRHDSITVSSRPVARIAAGAAHLEDAPVTLLAAFELLVGATDHPHLAADGYLDLLAELVERVPVVGPAPDGLPRAAAPTA